MKSLGGVVLPDETQWIDQHEWSPVAQEVATTLGGNTVFFSQGLTGGQPITLEIEDGITWLAQETVKAIQDMADQPGASFSLIWNDDVFSVRFRHHNRPAVSFQPLWPNHDLFTGTIKLIQG